MVRRAWAWLDAPRISWVDVGRTALIVVAATIVQYFTGWNEALAFLATAAAAVAVGAIAGLVLGVWAALRQPHNGKA